MTTPALICDTGALLDYLVASAPDHDDFRDAIDRARTRYAPVDIAALRPRLTIRQPEDALEGVLLELVQLADAGRGAELVPLMDEVMNAVTAFRVAVDEGLSARPLGSALAATEALVRAGARLADSHVQQLSFITHLPYSTRRSRWT